MPDEIDRASQPEPKKKPTIDDAHDQLGNFLDQNPHVIEDYYPPEITPDKPIGSTTSVTNRLPRRVVPRIPRPISTVDKGTPAIPVHPEDILDTGKNRT